MKKFKNILYPLVIAVLAILAYKFIGQYIHENKILKQVVQRLEADSRIAEVLVTGINFNEQDGKTYTTIKFLEYDVQGSPLTPRYMTFAGNIIQFQSLVVRFEDALVRGGDALRGKSVYLFWKAFMLDGKNTQEEEITKVNSIPDGYKLESTGDVFETKLWTNFWQYALNPKMAAHVGVKNAQIEAPGTMFVPGVLYTIKIEHDGGLRIDAKPLPHILEGETIPLQASTP
jgi:hypothetical protein